MPRACSRGELGPDYLSSLEAVTSIAQGSTFGARAHVIMVLQVLRIVLPRLGMRHRLSGRRVAEEALAICQLLLLDLTLAVGNQPEPSGRSGRRARTPRLCRGRCLPGRHGSPVGLARRCRPRRQRRDQRLVGAADAARNGAGASQQAWTQIQDLAGGSAEVASRLREAAETIADLAGRGALLGTQTRSEADQSSAAARQFVDELGRIGHVASTIDAIAAQTNLLALNATIEAARAGETGAWLRHCRRGGEGPGRRGLQGGGPDRLEHPRHHAFGRGAGRADLADRGIAACLAGMSTSIAQATRGPDQRDAGLAERADQTLTAVRDVAEVTQNTRIALSELDTAAMQLATGASDIEDIAQRLGGRMTRVPRQPSRQRGGLSLTPLAGDGPRLTRRP